MIKSGTKFCLLLTMTLMGWSIGSAQDLNCRVVVDSRQIESTERQIFTEMETEFARFINNRKWADERLETDEKIDCGLMINLVSQPSIGNFTATVQVISARPVYQSSYQSVLFNYADREFNFEYNESQPLDYNDNSYISNVTSMLAFYAYTVLGYDYDTFEKLGGEKYFNKAWQVVLSAQQSGFAGWDQFNSVRNRYWLSSGAVDQIMKPMREAMYDYHVKGMDIMLERPDEARLNILEVLKTLRRVNKEKPRSVMITVFMDAKVDEIASVFSQGSMAVRREAYNILRDLDPSRSGEFEKILSD